MDAERLKRLGVPFAAALAGLLLGLLIMALVPWSGGEPRRQDPRAVADAALVSVREQGRLASLTARYVAVVSSSRSRLGLEARKTLILPGTARYGLDLRRLRREHLSWDDATRTLSIVLPPLEISGPSIDMSQAREHSEGGVLLALTDAEQELDEANLRSAQQELIRQSREPLPLQTARDTAMRSVALSFALALRAAGIEASVAVRFQDPAGQDEAVHIERAPRIEDVVKDRQAGERPAP
jgi:hypothetical protein